jgi:glycosyltransferase involved in cell wall biosynthesis
MKIWLINPYGPIPGEGWRDYSFTMMGDILSKEGHEVIWWTSNFSHHFKKFRSKAWEDRKINASFTIRLVPTTSYRKNIGPGRIIRDAVFAFRTYIKGKKEEAPDCILYAESPLTFGYAGPKLAWHHNAALIYDQMDLWPELIVNSFPKILQPLVNHLFYPVYWRRKSIYKRLDGVMALAKPYLDVILDEVPDLQNKPNCVIYNGVDVINLRESTNKNKDNLPTKNPHEIWAIFAGSLGPSYDIKNLISVARILENKKSNTYILIAGDGPLRTEVELASSQCKNIRYLGKLAPDYLAKIYSLCDIGLCAYTKKSNVEMPDKFYDYTAAGLAILNSLIGEVSQQISTRNLGLQYSAGSNADLLNKILLLTNDRDLLRTMKYNSQRAGLEFDRNVQYSSLLSFIEKTVHCKRRNYQPI